MTETQAIQNEMRAAYEGDPWHGPSLTSALRGVTAVAAAAHPPGIVHSIWQLVAHCRGWSEVIVDRLKGRAASYPTGGNFPNPKVVTPSAWRQERKDLDAVMQHLLSLIASLLDDQLDTRAIGKNVTHRVMLRGNTAHIIYHTGQIVLLKKTLRRLGVRPTRPRRSP